jgi:branched-chain amino acid transport system ATP-binding protein
MLSVNKISVGYKGVLAVQEVSFEVNKGEVVSLIGSNGAGKSTIIKTVAGLLHPKSGEIHFENQPIHHTPPYDIVKKKISMIPEGRRLFGRLSTIDNLRLGAYALDSKKETEETLANVFGLFPILNERKNQRSETLSGGEQQQLAIARGLMSRPSEIFKIVHEISEKGMTVLLVEQNVFEALQISHRAYVLQTGRVVLEGKGDDLLKSDLVRQAYLGM